jgi:multiple sugar transport system permease protein
MFTSLNSDRKLGFRRKKKVTIFNVLISFLLIVVFFFPIYWMVITGLRPQKETFSNHPKLFPRWTLEHYSAILKDGTVIRGLEHSIVIALSATLIALVLGAPAAYVLARWTFKRKDDLWFWIISNRFISPIVVVLPFFLIAKNFNLIDTYWIMIAIYQTFAIPFVVWLSIDQFRAIPKEIDEAAAVDGASLWRIFFKINLPLAIPGLSVSAILVFVACWNELLFAQILTRDAVFTGPVVALGYMSGYDIKWGPMMATATLVVLPVVIFAGALSRNLVKGLAMGAVK